MDAPSAVLDHLVLATPDLDTTVAWVAGALGVDPTPGGQHVGLGTRNHLVGLTVQDRHLGSEDAYLEIIGPDPNQPSPAAPRPFGIDALDRPVLVGWAVRTSALDATADAARAAGYDPGPAVAMQRAAPTGSLLSWRLTMRPWTGPVDVVPFLIDWGTTPHPSTSAVAGTALTAFRAEHPDPAAVSAVMAALGVGLAVAAGPSARLHVELVAPGGALVLG